MSSKSRVVKPGVFDLFHVGHLRAINAAAVEGDELTVAVQDDRDVEQSKGQAPVVPLAHRMELIGALACVNEVISYRGTDLSSMLDGLRFDVLCVEPDYGATDTGQQTTLQWCREHAVRVHRCERVPGVSTTGLRRDIAEFWNRRGRQFRGAPSTMLGSCGGDARRQAEQTRAEVSLIAALIEKHEVRSVADYGCGNGRIGRELIPLVESYFGVDSSAPLIDQFASCDIGKAKLVCRDFSEVEPPSVDLAVMSGVFPCVDDDEMTNLASYGSRARHIFVRTSAAREKRIDIIRQWSPALRTLYTAHYRTLAEIDDCLKTGGLHRVRTWPLYQDHADTHVVAALYTHETEL